ncbi:hypothetical protein C8R45DRAFT_985543 [Mycena sanguinolenta]|nr:hypothetical protein C8R45DRAFT_985543 [Mycena sanguinolenta]
MRIFAILLLVVSPWAMQGHGHEVRQNANGIIHIITAAVSELAPLATQSSSFPRISEPSTTTTSDSNRISSTSSFSSTSATTTTARSPVPPATSMTVAAGKHKLSSGAVAGIAVVVIVFLLCTSITLLWQMRRRQLHHGVQLSDPAMNHRRRIRTISPFTLLAEASTGTRNTGDANSDVRGIGATRARVCAATDKIVELEQLVEGNTPNDPNAGGGRQLVSEGRASAPPPDVEAELRLSREQISILVARMNAMDAAWRMGMEVELPPEYV